MLSRLDRDEGLVKAPVVLLDDVANALATLEVPATSILAEKIQFDVGLRKIWRNRLLALSACFLNFEQHELAELASLDPRLSLDVLHLQQVALLLPLAVIRQQQELSVHLGQLAGVTQ